MKVNLATAILVTTFGIQGLATNFSATLTDIRASKDFISLSSDDKKCVLNVTRDGKASPPKILKKNECDQFFSRHHNVFTEKPTPHVWSPLSPLVELKIVYSGTTKKQLVTMTNDSSCNIKNECDKPQTAPSQAMAFDLQKMTP